MTYEPQYLTTLKTHMDEVLNVVVDVYEQAGIMLPERRFITFAQPIHDCEQLTVKFDQLYIGPPGDEATLPQRCESPRTAALSIEIVRCIPVGYRGAPPSQEQLEGLADTQAVDVWMLLEAIAQSAPFGVLGDVTVGDASGGYQGVRGSCIAAVGVG